MLCPDLFFIITMLSVAPLRKAAAMPCSGFFGIHGCIGSTASDGRHGKQVRRRGRANDPRKRNVAGWREDGKLTVREHLSSTIGIMAVIWGTGGVLWGSGSASKVGRWLLVDVWAL